MVKSTRSPHFACTNAHPIQQPDIHSVDPQMSSSSQGVYAANLQQNRGYPLFNPEPSSGLRIPYNTEGFQIGDVGYVDNDGEFTCLFNICFPLPAELRQPECGVPPFDHIPLENAFTRRPLALPEDHLFMTGVERHLEGLGYVCFVDTASNSNLVPVWDLPTSSPQPPIQAPYLSSHQVQLFLSSGTKIS